MRDVTSMILVFFSAICFAVPVPYFHADGTTHWFEAIEMSAGVDWSMAQDSAFAMGGYLATITSVEENDFVFSLIDSAIYWRDTSGFAIGPWIGGVQADGAIEPGGDWRWISGESFIYDKWSPGEPDDDGGANRIHFGGTGSSPISSWDDMHRASTEPQAFIVEFSESSRTLGLFIDDEDSYDGYTLFAPIGYTSAYLIDNQGRLVHSWDCGYEPGQSCYLLENGHLLYSAKPEISNPVFSGGGEGGMIIEFDWDGSVIWQHKISDSTELQHHDIEFMPSGNILVIAWEYRGYAECVEAGRDTSLLSWGELWPDKIIEIEPVYPDSGRVVWEWRAWDHLVQDYDPTKENYGVVGDHPEKIDLNYYVGVSAGRDWLHINAVDYNPEFDQIVLSIHNLHELWVIDHGTADYDDPASGIAEAAGPAGDLLYRWGNPAAYDRGFPPDRVFFGQHDAQWIEPGLSGEGDFLVFNNGIGDFPPPFHSSIIQITPPVDALGNYSYTPGTAYEPSAATWTYTAVPDTAFFSPNISGCQRLPNGNTLICEGAVGRFFEVTDAGEIVWQYINPVDRDGIHYQGEELVMNNVFRCYRYGPDYSAFDGRDLTPGNPIELYEGMAVPETSPAPRPKAFEISAWPNPFNSAVTISLDASVGGYCNTPLRIEIYDATGRRVESIQPLTEHVEVRGGSQEPRPSTSSGLDYIWQPDENIGSGVYLIRASFGDESTMKRIVYLK